MKSSQSEAFAQSDFDCSPYQILTAVPQTNKKI